jgi:hypothetical protein
MNSRQPVAWPWSEWITIASAWQDGPCEMSGSKRSRYSHYPAKWAILTAEGQGIDYEQTTITFCRLRC